MTERDDQFDELEIRIKGKQPPVPPPPAPPPPKGQAPITPVQYPAQPQYPVQYDYQQTQYPQVYAPVVQPPKSGKATTAMVLGIIGLVLCVCIAPLGWLVFVGGLILIPALILGVVAVVVGTLAKKQINNQPGIGGYGQAQAGFVMGIITVVLSALPLLVSVVFLLIFLVSSSQ